MKKSLILAGLVVSTGLLVGTQVAHAKEVDSFGTTGNVNIVGGSEVITPEPVEPFPPTGPYQPVGPIGISSATDLYFDDIELGSAEAKRAALYLDNGVPITNKLDTDGKFEAIVLTDSKDVYVPGYSVTDRRGTGDGWHLKLELDDFEDVGGSANVLRGASLFFPSVTPVTNETSTAGADEAPVALEVEVKAGGAAVILMTAEGKDEATGKPGQGKGLWEARYNSRELMYENGSTSTIAPIELTVPGDNYVGTYQANLTWTLSDEPVSEAPGA